jgi:threonine dehydratase
MSLSTTSEATAAPAGPAAVPDFAAIEAAAGRLAGHAVVTPLLEYHALNEHVGGRVLIKAETLQRTGSFKFRGAFNKLTRLAAQRPRPKGVVAFSSGNHAQGVAMAAKLIGFPAVIVMPSDSPAIKVERTRAAGAEIRLYDRFGESREAISEGIAQERGAAIVRPYDDADIIAGQGTAGLELANQARALGATPDAVIVPCSGGGLTAGVALAVTKLIAGVKVYAAEPAGFDDTTRSLAAGKRLRNEPGGRSICDALMAPEPGALTFPINVRLVAGGYPVSDAEVMSAMAFAFRELKLVVEPGGATALAALLSGKHDGRGRTTVVVCSGGNVDTEMFCKALNAG